MVYFFFTGGGVFIPLVSCVAWKPVPLNHSTICLNRKCGLTPLVLQYAASAMYGCMYRFRTNASMKKVHRMFNRRSGFPCQLGLVRILVTKCNLIGTRVVPIFQGKKCQPAATPGKLLASHRLDSHNRKPAANYEAVGLVSR